MFEIQGEATKSSLHVVRTEEEAFTILGILEPQSQPVRLE